MLVWQWIAKELRLPNKADSAAWKLPSRCDALMPQYLQLLKSTQLPGAPVPKEWIYKDGRPTATDTDEFEDMGEPGYFRGEEGEEGEDDDGSGDEDDL